MKHLFQPIYDSTHVRSYYAVIRSRPIKCYFTPLTSLIHQNQLESNQLDHRNERTYNENQDKRRYRVDNYLLSQAAVWTTI